MVTSGCGEQWLHDVPDVGSPHSRCGAVISVVPHLVDNLFMSIRNAGCCGIAGDAMWVAVVRGPDDVRRIVGLAP
jgi:hypothetical protein